MISPYIYPAILHKGFKNKATRVFKSNKVIRIVDEEFILQTICDKVGVSKEEALSKSRKQNLTLARQIFYFILYEFGQYSYIQIALLVGKQEHTTVLHGVSKVRNAACLYEDTYLLLLSVCTDINEKFAEELPKIIQPKF